MVVVVAELGCAACGLKSEAPGWPAMSREARRAALTAPCSACGGTVAKVVRTFTRNTEGDGDD